MVIQVAFPEDINDTIYDSPLYTGRIKADTSNKKDGVFPDRLDEQMEKLTINLKEGFTLSSTIV